MVTRLIDAALIPFHGMRRWFSKLGSSSSSANGSRATSPTVPSASVAVPPASTTVAVSTWTGRLAERDSALAVPPPPTPPCTAMPSAEHWNADFASDPTSWENTFDSHCDAFEMLIEDQGEITYEKTLTIIRHLGHMNQLLMMEVNAQPEPAIGPILDRYFSNQIMERIVEWAIDAPQFLTPTCQVSLIRIYEAMVSESHTQNHCLLVHKPMLLPLIRLLEWCRRTAERRSFTPSETDKHFVLLLNQICTKMAEDATLLHFFFTFGDENDEQFLVFSLLIPYLYDSGDVGQLARDALLLVLSVSRRLKHVAAFVAVKSNFCPVVATGLSGCFSQLPRNIGAVLAVGDDWHKISVDDIEFYPTLTDFHSSLLFCNAVVQVAHEYVVSQIVTYIYNGFLLPVVLPSLLQSGQDELISSTAYYHLCLDIVTEPPLIQALVKLLIVEECERQKKIIDVIVDRINAGNRLSQVSLSLLRTLIELRCEDVMLDLVFKYLLPCTFILPSQVFSLKNRISALPAANTLLSLIPECTLKSPALCSQGTLRSYMNESQQLVQLTADCCVDTWALPYDGRNPSPYTFRSSSDEENTAGNNFFVRQSSARSSLTSARSGLNRYFVSRLGHGTAESISEGVVLPELGQCSSPSPRALLSDSDSPNTFPDDDVDELIIPPITPNSVMLTSAAEYFQFAYEEVSESEAESSFGRLRIDRGGGGGGTTTIAPRLKKESQTSATNCDTDSEMARSFVLRGWGQLQDLDTFMGMLARVPCSSKSRHSLEENIALIDSRIQYLDELKADNEKLTRHDAANTVEVPPHEHCPRPTVLPIGRLIKCFEHQGVGRLLESLLRSLENMIENSLCVNLQVTSVLAVLASFTQPLIASYFFEEHLALRPGIKSLFKILSSLKTRIDAYASSVEGFDVLLERGIKFMKMRADKHEKALETNRFHSMRYPSPSRDKKLRNGTATRDSSTGAPGGGIFRFRPFGGSTRRFDASDSSHPHAFRYFSHKAMESRDASLDHARAKQVVFAAIVLSQFCQELAAIALQHATVVARPKVQQPGDI